MTYPFSLQIDALRIPVHLGVTAQERADPQTVTLWLKGFYAAAPDAAESDDAEYLCYDGLCQALLACAESQEFQLVEYLTAELFNAARAQIPQSVRLWMRVQKPLPPSLVGYEVEGASVVMSDLPEGVGV